MGFVLDIGHQGGGDTPGEHDSGEPDAGADFLQQHIGRHFKQCVADEKQPCTETIGGGTNAQIVLHVAAYEADVYPVDVVDDKHDDEKWQYMPLHFLDRTRQDGVVGVCSRRIAGSVHNSKPH